jgi:ATP-dependent Clp protease adaptor protein ClpS
MSQRRAVDVAMTAHQTGVAEVIVCAQEHAEMYQDLLQNDGLTVTIEPVDS